MNQEQSILVSEHAVALRLNRAMAEEGYKVRKARRASREGLLAGRWYLFSTTFNFILQDPIYLEELAREWDVLREWETVDFEED
jgi:hypothetical protein